MEKVIAALALYDAYLDEENRICRKGRQLGIRAVIKGTRLRFIATGNSTVATGPITKEFTCEFVERFWFWTKNAQNS